jgi:hypothetical protein
MDTQEVGWGGLGCVDVTQDRDCCECGNETSVSIKCEECFDHLKTC